MSDRSVEPEMRFYKKAKKNIIDICLIVSTNIQTTALSFCQKIGKRGGKWQGFSKTATFGT